MDPVRLKAPVGMNAENTETLSRVLAVGKLISQQFKPDVAGAPPPDRGIIVINGTNIFPDQEPENIKDPEIRKQLVQHLADLKKRDDAQIEQHELLKVMTYFKNSYVDFVKDAFEPKDYPYVLDLTKKEVGPYLTGVLAESLPPVMPWHAGILSNEQYNVLGREFCEIVKAELLRLSSQIEALRGMEEVKMMGQGFSFTKNLESPISPFSREFPKRNGIILYVGFSRYMPKIRADRVLRLTPIPAPIDLYYSIEMDDSNKSKETIMKALDSVTLAFLKKRLPEAVPAFALEIAKDMKTPPAASP